MLWLHVAFGCIDVWFALTGVLDCFCYTWRLVALTFSLHWQEFWIVLGAIGMPRAGSEVGPGTAVLGTRGRQVGPETAISGALGRIRGSGTAVQRGLWTSSCSWNGGLGLPWTVGWPWKGGSGSLWAPS